MTPNEWNQLEGKFPLLKSLESCPQEPEFHSEGNVKIHTQMVVDAAKELAKNYNLPTQSATDLVFCALFHDIGKPLTLTIDENGKASSPKHAVQGSEFLRTSLWRTPGNTPFSISHRETLLRAIALHAWPIRAFERPHPEDSAIRASLQTNNKLLGLLALADMQGRICQNPQVQKKGIEDALLYLDLCQEYQCEENPYPFANPTSKLHYLKENGDSQPIELFEKETFTVTILCGLPCSGKDHWLEKNYRHHVISRDQIRKDLKFPDEGIVLQELLAQIKIALAKKEPFAINATNLRRELRNGYASLIHSYGGKTHMVYLETSQEETFRRLKERQKTLPEKEHIPTTAIEKMAARMEPPTALECHQLSYIDNYPKKAKKKQPNIEPEM